MFDAREEAEADSSLSLVEKAQVLRILDHCCEQLQFVSNLQRQDITLGQFLADRDASSISALKQHTTSLLRKKLVSALGEGAAAGEIMDWESNGVRTSPLDHKRRAEGASVGSMLKDVVQGTESQSRAVDEKVKLVDPESGVTETRSVRDHMQVRLLREAKRLTELPRDMEQYTNFYENKLLEALMQPGDPEWAQKQQQRVVEEYMTMRLKTCMLNADFAAQVRNSDNGHLFLKVLRERVLDELKMTGEVELKDLLFETMASKSGNRTRYDLDSAYNMHAVNNTQAVGYDNLDRRSGGSDDKRAYETAHENVFDKLLADYYLSQRGEYAAANKTLQQLTEAFEHKNSLQKKHNRDNLVKDNLNSIKLEQDRTKAEHTVMLPRQAKNIFELDVLTY